ncbi:MAG: hypothetical protein IGQ45_00725 [Cyanobacterium sp. T60_A2020_053]|nr:hypothetical protein [Cyanobacterium sp. T60_A2020_053]
MLRRTLIIFPAIFINAIIFLHPSSNASEISEDSTDLMTFHDNQSDLSIFDFNNIDFDKYEITVSKFEHSLNDYQSVISPAPSTEYASEIAREEVKSNNSWHFLLQPSIYLPFTIYGDATAGSLSNGFGFDGSQIRQSIKDDLNFAFFAKAKAWNPDYRLGIFADFDYLSSNSSTSVTRTLPPSLGSIPVNLAEVDSKLWSLSFGGAYRFYDATKVNPAGIKTEFDLGPSVFDVFGGVNITGVDLGLKFSSPLGSARFDGNETILSPIVGARFRFNVNPQVAVVGGASYAGFGISGLQKWGISSGVDWLFSEKTSLGVGYRFDHTGYSSSLTSTTDFDLNVNQNGPYINVSFRF